MQNMETTLANPIESLGREGLRALKTRFAEQALRNGEDKNCFFALAQEIIGINHPGPSLQLAQQMASDPEVQEIIDELIDEHGGAEFFEPSKIQIQREVLRQTRSGAITKEMVQGYTLYAEMRGFITRGNTTNINNKLDNSTKVIQVPAMAQPNQWTIDAKAQQLELSTGA